VVVEQVDLDHVGLGGDQQLAPDGHPPGRAESARVTEMDEGDALRGQVRTPRGGRRLHLVLKKGQVRNGVYTSQSHPSSMTGPRLSGVFWARARSWDGVGMGPS
jgi:hypothetical protein